MILEPLEAISAAVINCTGFPSSDFCPLCVVYDHQGFDVGKKIFFFANNYFISVHISLICDHINRRIILALKFQLVEQYELNKITSSRRTIIYFRNQALF